MNICVLKKFHRQLFYFAGFFSLLSCAHAGLDFGGYNAFYKKPPETIVNVTPPIYYIPPGGSYYPNPYQFRPSYDHEQNYIAPRNYYMEGSDNSPYYPPNQLPNRLSEENKEAIYGDDLEH